VNIRLGKLSQFRPLVTPKRGTLPLIAPKRYPPPRYHTGLIHASIQLWHEDVYSRRLSCEAERLCANKCRAATGYLTKDAPWAVFAFPD
jgi:hypothetical protein